MRIFVINLEKDVERMKRVSARLEELGVAYERFPAIYVKGMRVEEKNKYCCRFRWRCANGRRMLDGELGCALSHMSIYRKMLTEGIDKACILEDDVVLDERFADVLGGLESACDEVRPSVYLLCNHMEPPEGQVGDEFVGYLTEKGCNKFHIEPCGWEVFSEGYVINASAAKSILAQNDPVIVPADAWCRWQDNGAIRLYRAFPTVCCQDKYGFESNMLFEAFRVKDLPPLRRLCYSAQRGVGLVVDKVLRLVTGR